MSAPVVSTNAPAARPPRPARLWPQVTALVLIVVELCWVVTWFRTAMEVVFLPPPLRTWLVLGGWMLAAYALTHLFENLNLVSGAQRGVLAGIYLLSVVVGGRLLLERGVLDILGGLVGLDPGSVLVVFASLWLWWRGVTLAREPIHPLYARRRFLLGVVMLLAHLLIVTRLTGETPGLGLFTFFLFAGLLGVVFARISYVSQAHRIRQNPFDRHWLWVTLGSVGLIVGLAAVLGSLLSGQLSLLLDWLDTVLRFVITVIVYVASLPWLLLAYLFGPLIPQARLPTPTPAGTAAVMTPSPYSVYPIPLQPREPVQISPLALSITFWALVGIVIVILVTQTRRGMRRAQLEEQADSEMLLGSEDLLRLLRKNLRQGFGDAANRLRSRLSRGRRLLAAVRIRRIYAELLELCAALNHPREPGQTPLEFLPGLGQVLPGFSAELELITLAYNRVRYGELPETQEEVAAVEAAWHRVQAEGQRLRKQVIPAAAPTAEPPGPPSQERGPRV